jgi:hypothetical protein
MSIVVAYYLWPPVWIGDAAPEDHRLAAADPGELILAQMMATQQLEEEKYRADLPVGITVKVFREGMFIFDLTIWLASRAQSGLDLADIKAVLLGMTTVLNNHLACLYTALDAHQHIAIEKMVISPADLIFLDAIDGSTKTTSLTRAAPFAFARTLVDYTINYKADWTKVLRENIIEIESVRNSFNLLSNIVRHQDADILRFVDLYTRGCKAIEDHDYSRCLVTAWTISEILLQKLWDKYIELNLTREIDGKKVQFIDKARKERLDDGRTFSASVITEILSLTDTIPFSLYRDLSIVRKKRNDWMHSMKSVSEKDAELSISVSERMIETTYGINIHIPVILDTPRTSEIDSTS